ncbi:hypothetical protein CERZMDRAFT_105964 [Cercospora zeae-maydis SCOH1-5]|uniref:Myb-like domain-containing protein n=1 Tax=Cercospora zeae-maydis SCOH1-5 TaxID=717836 RepID=A0A6A6FGM6_9PEZI|nr:hypothetical protein CERZMDRAFT_105964 [Cercospora zeae-maydis SCOH1-5]
MRIGFPVVHRTTNPAALETESRNSVRHGKRRVSEHQPKRNMDRRRTRSEQQRQERLTTGFGLQTPLRSAREGVPQASSSTTCLNNTAVEVASLATSETLPRATGSGKYGDPIVLDSDDDELSHRDVGGSLLTHIRPTCDAPRGNVLDTVGEWGSKRQELPASQHQNQHQDDACAQEPPEFFQSAARTFSSVYDCLLELGYVLPDHLDMEVMRGLAEPTVAPAPSSKVEDTKHPCNARETTAARCPRPDADLPKEKVDNRSPARKAEAAPDARLQSGSAAQLRETCVRPPRHFVSKLPVPKAPSKMNIDIPANGTGRGLSQSQHHARTTREPRGVTRSKLLYWTAEEDQTLIAGMQRNLNASEIRRRCDLRGRSESAIRSRRLVLKRKYPHMFDGD